MRNRVLYLAFVLLFVVGFFASMLRAGLVYPFEIFTDNGLFSDSGELVLFVEVSGSDDLIDFTFHNQSLIEESSIARIYFDSDLPLDLVGMTAGTGTFFTQFAAPGDLPAGKTLEPVFLTSGGLSFDSGPPLPPNGINPGEWYRVTLAVTNGGTFEDVIDGLDSGDIRVGVHVIALPDDSSESAVNIPEPLTFSLIMIGAAVLLKRAKSKSNPIGSKMH